MFSNNSDGKTWKVVNISFLFRELVFDVIMKIVVGKRRPSDQSTEIIFTPQMVMDVSDYLPLLTRAKRQVSSGFD